jgi:hypothetical protein
MPASLLLVPTGHSVHVSTAELEPYFPGVHVEHERDPAPEYLPSSQSTQTLVAVTSFE